MPNKKKYDAIIIGGSYAGLSAALALGRSLRDTLVIDSGKPCNRQTPHSHNFLTQDGRTPGQIKTEALKQLTAYPGVQFIDDLALYGSKTGNGFEVRTKSGEVHETKKLVFASGIEDVLPEIKGFRECWGISVIHCPYCHGYEFRRKRTGILANGERAFHLAGLVNNLTDELTIITQGKPDFSDPQLERLKTHSIDIIESVVLEMKHQNGYLKEVVFQGGLAHPFDAVYASIPFQQHSDIPVKLGCELTESGHLVTNQFQETSVPGVYACGDNQTPFRSVAAAVASGNIAGAKINMDLVEERF